MHATMSRLELVLLSVRGWSAEPSGFTLQESTTRPEMASPRYASRSAHVLSAPRCEAITRVIAAGSTRSAGDSSGFGSITTLTVEAEAVSKSRFASTSPSPHAVDVERHEACGRG